MQKANTYFEFLMLHRLGYCQRLSIFLFILRSASHTHSNILKVFTFMILRLQRFLVATNIKISKNIANIQQFFKITTRDRGFTLFG